MSASKDTGNKKSICSHYNIPVYIWNIPVYGTFAAID